MKYEINNTSRIFQISRSGTANVTIKQQIAGHDLYYILITQKML